MMTFRFGGLNVGMHAVGVAFLWVLLGCVAEELPTSAKTDPAVPPGGVPADISASVASTAINTSQDLPSSAALPALAPVEGMFPLAADTLQLNWTAPAQIPSLPLVCNFEYSAGHTPFLAFGFSGAKLKSECWDLSSGNRIGEIPDGAEISLDRSLSPDGRQIAFRLKGSDTIDIWSYETGTRLQTIDVKQDGFYFSGILLASADRLIARVQRGLGNFKYESVLKVFDITTGQLLNSTEVSQQTPPISSLAVSNGGRYLGYLSSYGVLEVWESASLQSVARIPIRTLERAFVGCSFSPDGTKLAGMMSNASETKIYVASLLDGSVSEILLPVSNRGLASYEGPELEWLPDQSGWVLFGQMIVNQKLRKQVWTIRCEGITRYTRRLTMQQAMLAQVTSKPGANGQYNPPELIPLEWPKNQVEALEADFRATASSTPLVHVDVSVTVGDLRFGEVTRIAERIQAVIAKAVRAIGLRSSSLPANMQLVVDYQESPGLQLYRREGSSLLIADAQLGGAAFRSTSVKMKFALQVPGSRESVWEAELVVDPTVMVIKGVIDEASIHAAVLEKTEQLLSGYGYPFYIDEKLTIPGESNYKL